MTLGLGEWQRKVEQERGVLQESLAAKKEAALGLFSTKIDVYSSAAPYQVIEPADTRPVYRDIDCPIRFSSDGGPTLITFSADVEQESAEIGVAYQLVSDTDGIVVPYDPVISLHSTVPYRVNASASVVHRLPPGNYTGTLRVLGNLYFVQPANAPTKFALYSASIRARTQ